MGELRFRRAKLNIIIPFACQIATIVCGFLLPRLLIRHYGSEPYGATASITQFLSYIALLEGGIGGVARAALYKPLAENNIVQISAIFHEIKRFFNVIGFIFLAYVIFLAFNFNKIADINCFDETTTILLVFSISISLFGQYFIGISNAVLIEASQRQYISNLINVSTMIFNTIMTIILVSLNCSLIAVKLASSLVYFVRPILLSLYVRHHFTLTKARGGDREALKQKWDGLGQHIAYFLHSNTDVAIITIFSNLTLVAVYSVYNMVINAVQSLTISFVTGMEALFGDMLARRELNLLHKMFDYYEMLISFTSLIMYGTLLAMIVPFVRIYTFNINDADYIAPIFSFILSMSSLLYCLRTPYHAMVIAAGKFKETRIAAYGEATINVILSIILVKQFGLIGIAIGTAVAVFFRLVYYVFYLSRQVFYRKVGCFIKRSLVNTIGFVAIFILASYGLSMFTIDTYVHCFAAAVFISIIAFIVAFIINYMFYKSVCVEFINTVLRKYRK